MTTEAPAVPTIAPGLHRGMSYDEYARIEAARHSFLCYFERTPAHARERMLNPRPETDFQAIGHAEHVAILEPARFELEFAAQPYMGDRRSSKVRADEDKFRADHPGITFLTVDEFDLCLRMRDAVWAHPTASEILRGKGHNEVTAVWDERETGIRCKARLDRLTKLGDWSVIADVKTSRDASPRRFSRDVLKYGYAHQGAMYLDGVDTLAPRPRKFVLIVVEKERPYCVAAYEMEQDALDLAADQYRKHLRTYADCLATGRWPGFDDGLGYISLPSWAFKFHGEEA